LLHGGGLCRTQIDVILEERMPFSRTPIPARTANLYVVTLLALLSVVGGASWGASTSASYQVSQRGRDFQPNQINVQRGETVRIVNDDADLLHHAYISSDKFNFDSNDMEPGTKVDIKFPVAGDFNVLCGIHPKMKLSVHVE
jgi:plastocyanin